MNITLTKPEIDLIAKALTLLSCVIDDSLKVDLIHVIAVIAASRRLGDPEIQELTRIGIEIR